MSQAIRVIGATGVVGRQVLSAYAQRDLDVDALRVFASNEAEGEEVDVGDESLAIETIGPDTFRGAKAVILAVPPEVAKPLAERAQREGVWSIDLSGAFRADAHVPMLSPGVNEGLLDRPFSGRIISLASAATQAMTSALEPLRAQFGLVFADATVLFGAAARGNAGIDRLAKQTAELLNAKEPEVEVFPHRLAFNVLPAVGDIDELGLAAAERSLLVEAARIWAGEGLPALTATSCFVPTYHGLTVILSAHLRRPVTADGLRAIFREDSNLKLLDEPSTNVYPMPMLTTDDAAVHVGRVRVLGERVQLVACVDNTFRVADTALATALELAERS